MNLDAVTMPVNEARAKVAEYLGAVRQRHSREDEQILRGYREILRGHRVLSLAQAFRKGGFHVDGTPKLAIVRADAERCYAEDNATGRWQFAAFRNELDGGRLAKHKRPVTVQLKAAESNWRPRRVYETIAPIVPPRLRPDRGLHLYHVLFEVEEWKLIAPVDPALVRHMGGDLWAVIATWDLTPLERLVLAGR